MIYELRGYELPSEDVDAFVEWANAKALPYLVGAQGIRLLGAWRVARCLGEPPPMASFYWIAVWESLAEAEETWARARDSGEWQGIRQQIRERIPDVRLHRVFLEGIARSPLR